MYLLVQYGGSIISDNLPYIGYVLLTGKKKHNLSKLILLETGKVYDKVLFDSLKLMGHYSIRQARQKSAHFISENVPLLQLNCFQFLLKRNHKI